MMKTMKHSPLILFNIMIALLFFGKSKALNRCEVSPKWNLPNFSFPKDLSKSEIKLIAFLKSSCGFCRNQSIKLAELRDELAAQDGSSKIGYVIINAFKSEKLDLIRNITSITVLQDNNVSRVWKLYDTDTDDIVILDKCNRLVFHLSWPDSLITSGMVKESLKKAYKENLCEKPCVNVSRRPLFKPKF